MSAATNHKGVVYAGFWERFAAVVIDGLLVITVWLALVCLFALGVGEASEADDITGLQHALPIIMFGLYCALALPVVAYFVLAESGKRGATLGKWALKLRVTDNDGKPVGIVRGLGRFVAHILSGCTLCIGYLTQPFTARRQALHDLVSGTLVVRVERTAGSLAVVLSLTGGFFVLFVGIGLLASVATPKYQNYLTKSNLLRAEEVGRVATQAVANYASHTGNAPASLAETGVKLPFAAEVADVTVNPQSSEVNVVLRAGMGRNAGKALVFYPSQNAQGQIVWKCSAPGISQKSLLPADCR